MARTCHGNAVLCLSSAGIVPSSSLTKETIPRLRSCEVDLIHLITTGRVQGLLPAVTCTQGESNTKSTVSKMSVLRVLGHVSRVGWSLWQ